MLTGIDRRIREAHEVALDKEEGWSSAGENSDGGIPLPLTEPPPKKITDPRLLDSKKPNSNNKQANYNQPQGSWDGPARPAAYTAQGINARLSERSQASSWRAPPFDDPQEKEKGRTPEAEIDTPLSRAPIQQKGLREPIDSLKAVQTTLTAAAKPFVLAHSIPPVGKDFIPSPKEENLTTGPNPAMTDDYQSLADDLENTSIDAKPKVTVKSGTFDKYGWPIYHLE